MPRCQAIFCKNEPGGACKKSFFRMPDPTRSKEERKLCRQWILNLKNAKLDIKNFVWTRSRVVCEDHFTEDSFDGTFANKYANAFHFHHKKKTLKKGAVPTIIKTKNDEETKVRKATDSHQRKRRICKLKEQLQCELNVSPRNSSLPTLDYSLNKNVSCVSDERKNLVYPEVVEPPEQHIDKWPVDNETNSMHVPLDNENVSCVSDHSDERESFVYPEVFQPSEQHIEERPVCTITESLLVPLKHEVNCESDEGNSSFHPEPSPQPKSQEQQAEVWPEYTAVPVEMYDKTDAFQNEVHSKSAVRNSSSHPELFPQPQEQQTEVWPEYTAVPVEMCNKTDDFQYENQQPVHESQLLDCGHPCVLCVPSNPSAALLKDHTYCGTPSDPKLSSTKQTVNPLVRHSTPKKLIMPPKVEVTDLLLDDTFTSTCMSFRDDSKDISYVLESETDSNESFVKTCPSVEEKYIVFKSCIHDLIIRLKCPLCEKPVDVDEIIYETGNGTMLVCSVYCLVGHLIFKWHSQPLVGKMPAGNLLTSAAILYSGQTYARVAQFANFLNLQFISHTTYEKIQRQQLMPVIMDMWLTVQKAFLADVRTKGRPLRLSGDGRCDSPGFSAKYCTYSLMDMETDAIVTFIVIKVTETGSSSRMEAEGFRRCMNFLLDEGCSVEVLATDRHAQIRSIVKKEFPSTEHQFDVWHLSNSIKKKLIQKSKLKGAEELGPWTKAICNHLWWCASQCNGDADLLEESWVSVIHHVSNVHEFAGEKFTRCAHEELTNEQVKKKKWLKVGTRAHNSLKEVVLDKRLRKDIKQLSKFCHTGGLEVFHSMMTKYVPKRQEFDHDQMTARTALAAIDHNMSLGRQQKTNLAGDLMYKAVCPKASGQWVAKPVYEDKTYKWVSLLLSKTVEQKEESFLPATTVKKKENIAPRPAPSKLSLVENLKSRFKMTC